MNNATINTRTRDYQLNTINKKYATESLFLKTLPSTQPYWKLLHCEYVFHRTVCVLRAVVFDIIKCNFNNRLFLQTTIGDTFVTHWSKRFCLGESCRDIIRKSYSVLLYCHMWWRISLRSTLTVFNMVGSLGRYLGCYMESQFFAVSSERPTQFIRISLKRKDYWGSIRTSHIDILERSNRIHAEWKLPKTVKQYNSIS